MSEIHSEHAYASAGQTAGHGIERGEYPRPAALALQRFDVQAIQRSMADDHRPAAAIGFRDNPIHRSGCCQHPQFRLIHRFYDHQKGKFDESIYQF